MRFWDRVVEKFNPVQRIIAQEEGGRVGSTQTKPVTIYNAFATTEIVNRCVNMIVDSASQVEFDVQETLSFTPIATGIRKASLIRMLSHRPNPYMDISNFWRLVIMDFLIDGNSFIYFDGHGMYHLPAGKVEVKADETAYIHSYIYNGMQSFSPGQVIHIRDNSVRSVFRGDSRINSMLESLGIRQSMQDYNKNFFLNGTAVGLIVESEAILSKKMKDRTEREWMSKYSVKRSAGRPMILDGGLTVKSLGNTNFKEMMYSEQLEDLDNRIATALGVPPILLDSGNNANIRPNLELFFSMTIIPMMQKFESALENFFAFDIQLSTHRISALQPDRKAESERLSALVNNGIMTGNEARKELRLEPLDDPQMNEIRIPQNIAGSATGATGQQGGAPPKDKE